MDQPGPICQECFSSAPHPAGCGAAFFPEEPWGGRRIFRRDRWIFGDNHFMIRVSDSLFPSKEEFKKNLRRNFGIPTNPRERRATRRYLKKYGWRIAGRWLLILLASPFLWLYGVLKEWLYELPKFYFYDIPRKLWRFFSRK